MAPSLKVRTAASQAANVEFESRRGHLWVGRIVAIAADCKSADFGLRQFESGPAHLCLRVRVGLRYHWHIAPFSKRYYI